MLKDWVNWLGLFKNLFGVKSPSKMFIDEYNMVEKYYMKKWR